MAHALTLTVVLSAVHATAPLAQAPAPRAIRFEGAEWVTTDPEAKIEKVLGREALSLRTGEIWRRDVRFTNGTIEFDMAPRPVRSFLGVMFRVSEESGRLTYEDVYFRPTASGQWDAVQYEPVFQGIGGWQLYHGDGFTAASVLPTDRWTHVRVVVSGQTADVYLDRGKDPVLRVRELKGTRVAGHVGFWGFFPGGEPRSLYTANFANVRITPSEVSTATTASPRRPMPGVIRKWRLAEPVDAKDRGSTANVRFVRTIEAEHDTGIVNLNREFPHSVDAAKPKTWASATIDSTRPQRVPLHLGFSDRVRVLLNGELLFAGTNVFMRDYPPSMGLVRLGDHTVYLPLRSGTNELVLEMTETEDFGWGFVAALGEADGVVLR